MAVEHISQYLRPERPLGGTAGKDDLVESKPRERFDDLHMAIRDISRALFDGTDALLLTRGGRVRYIELYEPWRGMDPAFGVHEVGKDPHHPIGTGRRL